MIQVLMILAAMSTGELERAQELAWSQHFAEAEAIYRHFLEEHPQSPEARLGLARVVLWQGRTREALSLFETLGGIEALEGRATAHYWSGDFRAAEREFRGVLALDPHRDSARRPLAEIESAAQPWQRAGITISTDDQPLDAVRAEVTGSFFSDAQTQWSATLGRYAMDADRTTSGSYVVLGNETVVRSWKANASAGLFTFPDGVRRPVASASLRRRSLSFLVDHQPELASAPALATHVASTTTTLRWEHERTWIAAVELNHRTYSDDNRGRSGSAYLLLPIRRAGWTIWTGASMALRDTNESRFTPSGRYDPYWTPDDLREARAVIAMERSLARATIRVHADAGQARDRAHVLDATFSRSYRPWRTGVSGSFILRPGLRLDAEIEHSVTVDYRVTTAHVFLVRRR